MSELQNLYSECAYYNRYRGVSGALWCGINVLFFLINIFWSFFFVDFFFGGFLFSQGSFWG
jgi:hypothetical protein